MKRAVLEAHLPIAQGGEFVQFSVLAATVPVGACPALAGRRTFASSPVPRH